MNGITILEKWLSLYVADVLENPECYKQAVIDDPEASGRKIVDGLANAEIFQMTQDLRRERKAVAKANA